MSVPTWRMVYADLAGNPLGEVLDAHERKLDFQLLAPNTISFKQELVSAQVVNFLTQKEGLILAYKNGGLAMTAELSSIEVEGADDGLHEFVVVATETMYPRLTHRLLGQSSAGLVGPTTPTDQGLWLMDRLDALNAINPTGLRDGAVTRSGNISGGTWRFKQFMELMQELSATDAGFDFYQRPRNPKTTGLTGVIDIAPVLGTLRKNVVFEYGAGAANARAYKWLIHNEAILNKALVLPPQFPDNAGLKIASASDAPSQAARGLREEVVPSDVSSYALRSQYAALHVALRKVPREQFIIQPAPADGSKRVPQFLRDYNVGDVIRGRVQDQSILMLDAFVRLYGATVTLSDEGMETVDLTLIADQAAASSNA